MGRPGLRRPPRERGTRSSADPARGEWRRWPPRLGPGGRDRGVAARRERRTGWGLRPEPRSRPNHLGRPWFYLCEDDQGRHNLPAGRIADLIEAVERFERDVPGPPVGAVVASGRHIDLRTGRTSNHVFGPRGARFEEVDYGPFFGALLSRRVLGARVVPDEDLFWWAEDLDFSLRIRAAGFRVLVDTVAQKATTDKGSSNEPWCGYYMARNNFHLRRRYGGVRWDAWHILKSARRFQRAPTNAHRIAIVRGFLDGVRGRRGRHPEFSR